MLASHFGIYSCIKYTSLFFTGKVTKCLMPKEETLNKSKTTKRTHEQDKVRHKDPKA